MIIKIDTSRGTVFITIMIISMLMVFIAVSASNMLLQDAHMIKYLKHSTQARYLAEAGISAAMATLANQSFSAKDNPANFPLTNLGDGTYDVTVYQNNGRVLLRSEGVVRGVSKTVSLEVRDDTPTSLYYMMSAGTDLRFRAFLIGLADFNGDMHANRDVRLRAQALALIDIDPCGGGCCNGDVSACNTVEQSVGFLAQIRIAGSVIEGAAPVTFPNFDYVLYQATAAAGGDYYAGDVDFGAIGTTTELGSTNGIIYVEGTASIYGRCNLSGGLVADRIRVIGQLNQTKTGTKNVIIARGENTVGDIEVFYRLDVEEAIVYAKRDFSVLSAGSFINVTGALIAARNIKVWDCLTYVVYNHKLLYPEGLVIGAGGAPLRIVSWNK